MKDSTRLTLIQRVTDNKDEKSWEEFFGVYRPYIMGLVKKMGIEFNEVEDITQKILVTLWQKMPDFEYRPGQCKFRSWVTLISRTAINDFRKLKQNKMRNKIDSDEIPESKIDSEVEQLSELEWKKFIYNLAWERIAERFKEKELNAFKLSSKKSAKEVAEETGLGESTVYLYKKRVETAMLKDIYNLNYELG